MSFDWEPLDTCWPCMSKMLCTAALPGGSSTPAKWWPLVLNAKRAWVLWRTPGGSFSWNERDTETAAHICQQTERPNLEE